MCLWDRIYFTMSWYISGKVSIVTEKFSFYTIKPE